jgi:hypothetical protein
MSSAELRENRTLGGPQAAMGARGTRDGADEVTLSRKGATSPTRARKLRSTGTKAKARVSNRPNSLSELKKQLEARTRELAEGAGAPFRGAGATDGDLRGTPRDHRFARRP